MLTTIEAYLMLRRATGFAMSNAEYLLKSFAAFAAGRGQTHVHTQTAIDWATLGPSWHNATRGSKPSAASCAMFGLTTPGTSWRRPITSVPAKRAVHRTSTRHRRSITSSRQLFDFGLKASCAR